MGVIRVSFYQPESNPENPMGAESAKNDKFMHYKCAKWLKYDESDEIHWEITCYQRPKKS